MTVCMNRADIYTWRRFKLSDPLADDIQIISSDVYLRISISLLYWNDNNNNSIVCHIMRTCRLVLLRCKWILLNENIPKSNLNASNSIDIIGMSNWLWGFIWGSLRSFWYYRHVLTTDSSQLRLICDGRSTGEHLNDLRHILLHLILELMLRPPFIRHDTRHDDRTTIKSSDLN